MKTIVAILFFFATSTLVCQNKALESWIENIVNDMVEMNELNAYISREISPEYNVNFIMVETVKDIKITDSQISMLVNHGKGTYCTKIVFEYIQKNENFYLVFSEPQTRTTLGKETEWIDPWIKKENICD